MMDVCTVYGRANRDLVSKMIANLFKQQVCSHVPPRIHRNVLFIDNPV